MRSNRLATIRLVGQYVCLLAIAGASLGLATPASAGGPGPGEPGGVVGVLWTWQETQTRDGEIITPDDPTRYTLELLPDGRVAVRADCNRGFGTYSLEGDLLTIGLLGVTRAACAPGSLGDTFVTQVGGATFSLAQDSGLYLDLAFDGDTMRFERA